MKKLGIILILVCIVILCILYLNQMFIDKEEKNNVTSYLEKTSKLEESDDIVEKPNDSSYQKKNYLNYVAILEIPKIKLKRGMVNNTKNFNSISYAISIDNHSNYPNENGNLIIYAHSGRGSIAYFNDLDKLEKNDDIYVYYEGIKYHYVVDSKYNIEKTGKAKIINSSENKYITLITCNQKEKGYQVVVIGTIKDSTSY